VAVVEVLACDERHLLVSTLVDQLVLPLAEITVFADGRVERDVAAEPAIQITSPAVTASRWAMVFTWSDRMSPLARAEILRFAWHKLKNSFFWLTVVPIFTSDHERRMYSCIAALIHHVA
jgi:hypothetical protein